MSLEIRLAVEGDLRKAMRAEETALAEAMTAAMREAGEFAKQRLRDQVTGAGLGPRLARSVRVQHFPPSGVSMEAAAFVFSRARKILEPWAEGLTVRSASGFFLAIPTKNAPKRGIGGGRISPSNWPDHRFGPLRFVFRRNGASMLVADNLRASFSRKTKQFRGFRQASQRAREKGETATAVMFFLVPQARFPKRLNTASVARAAQARVPALFARHLAARRTRLSEGR